MTNVVVARKRAIHVSTNATAGIIDTSVPVVLKNNPVIGGGVTRLDHLNDVVANGETQGATLVYDSATDKYFVQKLNLADVTGALDGGTF